MLNRHTLRVKIMQSLFAYDRCREANTHLAKSYLAEHFSPDLNSMETQDKVLLKKQHLEAKQLISDMLDGKESTLTNDSSVDAAVKEALDISKKQTEKDLSNLKKNLVADVEKINQYYHEVLGLLIAFAEAAKNDKKLDLPIFSNNTIVKALKSNTELQKTLIKEDHWASKSNQVMSWYREIVKPNLSASDFEESGEAELEKKLIKHISRKLVLSGTINDYFAERDIRWSEDRDIVKSLVDKTIKSYDAETEHLKLQKLSLDWEDDLSFMSTLFEEAATIDEGYKELIARNTKNWEVDRLPLTDRIILEMAIMELISFPSIPIKVSINEYIELTKRYSTPKSPKFINGILDVIAKELQSTGIVKKSGRGLIDNK